MARCIPGCKGEARGRHGKRRIGWIRPRRTPGTWGGARLTAASAEPRRTAPPVGVARKRIQGNMNALRRRWPLLRGPRHCDITSQTRTPAGPRADGRRRRCRACGSARRCPAAPPAGRRRGRRRPPSPHSLSGRTRRPFRPPACSRAKPTASARGSTPAPPLPSRCRKRPTPTPHLPPTLLTCLPCRPVGPNAEASPIP